jgi:hypothetical protein
MRRIIFTATDEIHQGGGPDANSAILVPIELEALRGLIANADALRGLLAKEAVLVAQHCPPEASAAAAHLPVVPYSAQPDQDLTGLFADSVRPVSSPLDVTPSEGRHQSKPPSP